MYHALLTNRYLTTRVIPLIAVGAVALCVALVIIVVSVMTGFLDMVKSSGRTLMGDVVVSYPYSGIPYYERLIGRIEALPEAAAATPVVDSWGLLKMPYPEGPNKATETVQLWGIEPESFARVTGFEQTLHWHHVTDEQWRQLIGDVVAGQWSKMLADLSEDQKVELLRRAIMLSESEPAPPPDDQWIRDRLRELTDRLWADLFAGLSYEPGLLKEVLTEAQWTTLLSHDERLANRELVRQEGLALRRGGQPGIVTGIHVSRANQRQSDGTYRTGPFSHWWMPRFNVTLTTLPVSGGGLASEPESVILPVVNEFISGVYLIDERRVMVPIEIAQRLMHLDEGEIVDETDPTQTIGRDPARATLVLVRAVDGVTPEQLRPAVMSAYEAFYEELRGDPETVVQPPALGLEVSVRTWAQQQAQFIGPVEKERELMRTLFSIVYLVCAGLVVSIFWAIVYEKTRDIGILRSIGASRGGIVWIFLRYGLVVGVLGSIAGVGLALVVIHNINGIHDALADPPILLAVCLFVLATAVIALTIITGRRGRLLPIVLGSITTVTVIGIAVGIVLLKHEGGIVIWDPSVYYFTEIPNVMDKTTAITTAIGAVLFSVLGAAIPAAKAADIDPVHALRYE